MTLRLGVDATAWANPRGDGRFVRNAVRALVADHPGDAWTLVTDPATAARDDLPQGAALRAPPVRADALRADTAARGPLYLLRLARAARGFDAFLCPSVLSWFPVPGTPAVVGLHDVTSLELGEDVLPAWHDRLLFGLKRAAALRRAARVFTVSEASRVAIARRIGLPAEEIAVVPEAPDPVFAPRPEEEVRAALEELGLPREPGPIVFAAGISPHKGLDTLLDAYAELRRRGPAPPLVIAGGLDGLYASAAAQVRSRAGAGVLLPGHVPDATLACLLTAASAAVVPSRAEGFGLPAVEAAACGAPPVLSDLPAHRESLGRAARFFPPGDATALAAILAELVGDEAARREVGERARAAAAGMSWEETGRRLRALLAEAAGGV